MAPAPFPDAALRLRQPLAPRAGLRAADDRWPTGSRTEPFAGVESASNLAVRQCLLELLHASVRELPCPEACAPEATERLVPSTEILVPFRSKLLKLGQPF